ncbi:4HBT-2 domain containing protein [Pyrenophora tritici-repentis]|nr:4HBT-2 domain containing protein [Pyrenophora tritici-repentis]
MAREYAIKVEVPPGRFQTFRLMLSLPYLMLREKPIQSSQSLDLESQEKLTAYDLSFLVDPAATKNPTRFVIKEAHETVAIFGRKDHNWTGYAFSAPHMDMESETDNGDEDECDEEMPNVDLFVSGRSDEVIDPNITIYDPRTYFLRTFEIRIKVIQKEYGWLVKELQNLTTCWMKSKVYTFGVSALLHDQDQRTSLKQTLEDLVNLKGVLQDVRSHLADTLLAWRDFSKDDGHISVFSDMTAEDANKALEGIKHSFAQLGLLEQKLGQLHRQCIDSADVVRQPLTLRMESENYLLGRHMHELNFRTTELAGKTTQIALRSQQIAEETNRTTRTNVQLLMITTPFAFALQYFCGDSNFFSIERTPKAFVISLVVLFLALPIVNVSVDALHQGRKALLQWVATKLGRKGGPADDEQLDPKSLDTDFTEVV